MNHVFILSVLLFLCCCSFQQQSHAFSITDMLSQYPDLSSFSNYLSQAQIVNDINNRNSITVLAVDNGGMGSLSGQGNDVIRTIMSIHVLLDYFDAAKFRTMVGSTLTPTLYQTTGRAAGQTGFVNLTVSSGGAVQFGSGVEGSTSRASLVKTVVAQPYNISVLQISGFIFPKGIENGATSTPPPPPPPPAPLGPPQPPGPLGPPPPPGPLGPPPPPSTTTSPPSPSNTTSPPSPSNTTSPPSPSTSTSPSPNPATPVKAPSPVSGSPKTSPSKSPKSSPSPTDIASGPAPVDGPLADSPVADDKAGGSTLRFGGGLILTLVAISSWLTMG